MKRIFCRDAFFPAKVARAAQARIEGMALVPRGWFLALRADFLLVGVRRRFIVEGSCQKLV